jgi:hypothetical protein
MSEKLLNIYQRINEVRKKINYVQKGKDVSTGGGSYKAITHDEVTGQVRAHLIEFGVVCVPSMVDSRVSYPLDKQGNQTNMIRYEATYDFTFANADDPKDAIVIRIEAHAMDNQDKAPGKALSYAKKYAVLKLFEIETGDAEESRFAEKEEFPMAEWLGKINGAGNLEELAAHFGLAYESAKAAGAVAEAKVLISAKDAMKKKLEPK